MFVARTSRPRPASEKRCRCRDQGVRPHRRVVNNVGTGSGRGSKRPAMPSGRPRCSDAVSRGPHVAAAVPHLASRAAAPSSSCRRSSAANGRTHDYNAVKAAEISLAKSLAQQLAKDQIRVVSVAPGSTLFEGGSWWKRQQSDPEGIAKFVEAGVALRRLASRRKSAPPSRFLRRRRPAGLAGRPWSWTDVSHGCSSLRSDFSARRCCVARPVTFGTRCSTPAGRAARRRT